ncbi:MAG: glycine cleavage system aminomethyltransferase GcvT [Nitrospirota bacterium]
MAKSPLHDRHKALQAKLVDFHGWEMPLEYSGAVKEHVAVRTAAGLFDVSHMGVIEVGGADSMEFLSRVLTFSPETLKSDRVRYAFFLNERGGIKDDLMVFRLNEERFILVVNASNREKDLNWLRDIGRDFRAVLIDDSPDTCILALQGPASWEIAVDAFGIKPSEFPYHSFINFVFSNSGIMLSKTGYTGEKGFEIYSHRTIAGKIWDMLLEKGRESGLLPCGLAARDTLRLEMGYLLYGNDIDEDTNPIEAGYLNFIDFGNEKFIGRDALLKVKETGPARKLAGLVLTEPGVPRRGYPVTSGGPEIGVVTSGNFSPSLHKGIAMGYLPVLLSGIKAEAGKAEAGPPVAVVIRGKAHAAEVVETPFYRKK